MRWITTLLLLVRLAMGALDEDLQAKYETMPLQEFIEYFNNQNYSFTIKDYGDSLPGHCEIYLDYKNINDLPIQTHDPSSFKDLPDNFDSRKKWYRCKTIREVYDQRDCGSCWTFGTANTASDRSCIHANLTVHLAEQDFECQSKDVCKGGSPNEAFEFWIQKGLVTDKCKPYNVDKLKEKVCHHECVNKSIDYIKDKLYGESFYAVSNASIDNIKAELFKNGPIQAAFRAYLDLRFYVEGVYEHKWGPYIGDHSVRVIGYGVENGENYWLVVNSWSYQWGEYGYFKVKSFAADLEFENMLLSGLPRS